MYFTGPTYTTSRYGNPVMLLGGHRFNRYCRSTGPRALWSCNKVKCGASVTTYEGQIIKINPNHNH